MVHLSSSGGARLQEDSIIPILIRALILMVLAHIEIFGMQTVYLNIVRHDCFFTFVYSTKTKCTRMYD